MAISKDEILETISQMTVLEIVDLISAMEKKFNVTAQAPIAMAMPSGGATPAA
ncbi:50S ribosomal protein L7/L12, partial [mine drainage metagenome]